MARPLMPPPSPRASLLAAFFFRIFLFELQTTKKLFFVASMRCFSSWTGKALKSQPVEYTLFYNELSYFIETSLGIMIYTY